MIAVLILIVVEDGLVQIPARRFDETIGVLLLIVVEDGLVPVQAALNGKTTGS